MTRRAIVLLLLAVLASPAIAADVEDSTAWYAILLGDRKSGWMRSTTTVRGAGDEQRTTTVTELHLALQRAGTVVSVRFLEEYEEDAQGLVLRFRLEQDLGFAKQVTIGRLRDDGKIEVDGGKRVIDYPAGALGPAAADRAYRNGELVEGRESSVNTFSSSYLGQVVLTKYRIGAREAIDLLGRKMDLRRVEATMSVLPGFPTVVWIDDDGDTQAMEIAMAGLGRLRMVRTGKAIALRDGEPAELFTTTFLHPDRSIADPRRLRRATYVVAPRKGAIPDLPTGTGQRSTRREDGSLTVVVDLTAPPPARLYELPCREEARKADLAPNDFLESRDPRVVALAREAVGDEKDPVAAGRAIEALVRRKIESKNLAIVFATAAAVAEHLEGDCSEHAVLCAAMARAVGLPSRVVTGLVYLPPGTELTGKTGVFGYHMWAEVYVGADRWMAIDAAIGTMDATHIAIVRSGLNSANPLVELVSPILGFLENVDLRVLEPR